MKSLANTRKLRLESLEERTLLAVVAGGIETGAELMAPTEATTWVVNTLDDPTEWDTTDEVLSLREAIDDATDGDTIVFDSGLAGGTITLCGNQLEVYQGITIDASAIDGITIDANKQSRVLSIGGGTEENPVELISLTITGGMNGGINTSAKLIITNCTIAGNVSNAGGAGICNNGYLTLSNCKVIGNAVPGWWCGGIANMNGGTILIENSIIRGNIGDGECGGISNIGDSITMINTVVDGNIGAVAAGVECISGTTNLVNCSITNNNSYAGMGGGIVNWGPSYSPNGLNELTMINCAVYGNYAYYYGGGIFSRSNSVSLINCTIAGNYARERGGGISGSANLTNCIVALNKSLYQTDDLANYYGTPMYSVSIIGKDPGFESAPIFEYGYLKNLDDLNLSLSSRSCAIDMGSNDVVTTETDIVGNPRIIPSLREVPVVDIGAYEYQGTVSKDLEIPSTVVTTSLDIVDNTDNLISLREALIYGLEGDTITFDSSLCGGHILLDSSSLLIDRSITIDASSIGGITIDGDSKYRVFELQGGIKGINVVMVGLKITGGYSSEGYGGAIYGRNSGNLTLTNCIISKNVSDGVYVFSPDYDNPGVITFINSTVVDDAIEVASSLCFYNSIAIDCITNVNGDYEICAYNSLSDYTDWTDSNNYAVYDSSKPLFTNESGGDYTLTGDSQAIDIGDNSYVTSETDFAGNVRIYNGIVDIGAYEYIPPVDDQATDFVENAFEETNNTFADNPISPPGETDVPEEPSTVVTTLEDVVDMYDGLISLREAISYDPYDITFADNLAGGTISLKLGELVADYCWIDATSVGGITIDAHGESRVLNVKGGARLAGLTIANGVGDYGGGIFCSGYQWDEYNSEASLVLVECSIVNNSANVSGGGIFLVATYCGARIEKCNISSNAAALYGGGVYCAGIGELDGIYVDVSLSLLNSTVADNNASYGGGIYMGGRASYMDIRPVSLTNCVVAGNVASYYGGGIYAEGGVTLRNSTVTRNYADCVGGGVFAFRSSTFYNSIVVENKDRGAGSDIYQIGYSTTGTSPSVSAYNTLSSYSEWDDSENCLVYDPNLSLFTDIENGDYTLTSDSQAINVGNNEYVVGGYPFRETDLVGNYRIIDVVVDLGAYEFHSEHTSIVVTTLDDIVDEYDGLISLREAVELYANDGDTVAFAPELAGGTIVLGGSEIEVTKGITIDASDVGGITIDGNQESRIFGIYGGTEETSVELVGLTITGGDAKYDRGGGILNSSSKLTITDSLISGNSAGYGGGIQNHGTLIIKNSTISGNFANYGGGIQNYGTLTIKNSTISGNFANSYGGGVSSRDYNFLTLVNTVVANNAAGYGGGGFYDNAGILTLTNCTVTGNTADFLGGGIFNEGAVNYVYNTIIAQNSAGSQGDDIFNHGSYNDHVCGYNTLSSFRNWNISANCLLYDPLAPLFADPTNGDYALVENSQAINRGRNNYIEDSQVDIDGNTRIVDGIVDLGAFEYQEEIYKEYEAPSTTVTTNLDFIDPTDGLISLREAILYAIDGETITFDSNLTRKTFTLDGQALIVDKSLTIDASNIGGATINSAGCNQTIEVSGGTVDRPVVLIGLTITCCSVDYFSENTDTGLYNSGTAKLVNCVITGNSQKEGRIGIRNSGDLSLINCTVAGNIGKDTSYGIYNESGTASLYNTIVVQNGAADTASDIFNESGSIFAYHSLSTYEDWTDSIECLMYDASKPLFAEIPGGYFDKISHFTYFLADDSQAIDKGNNIYISGIRTDIARNTRIVNGIIDIGACEYGQEIKSTVVTTSLDIVNPADNLISLREALDYARDGDIITFDPRLVGTVIMLDGADLWINKNISIDASSIGGITIDGDGKTGILVVGNFNGQEYSSGNVELRGLNLIHGNNYVPGYGGGAIMNMGHLSLMDCSIIGNTVWQCGAGIVLFGNNSSLELVSCEVSRNCTSGAIGGGGILNYSGKSLVLTDCIISKNSTFGSNSWGGGGISLSTGIATLTNCIITENSSSAYAGGIYNGNGTMILTECAVTNNISNGSYGWGGGICNGGDMTIINCLISDNVSEGGMYYGGGGIFNTRTLSITNSAILGNSAVLSGGGILNYLGDLTLTNCTVAANTARDGGGVSNGLRYGSGTAYIHNTIITQNTAEDEINDVISYGSIYAYNTISSFTDWTEATDCLVFDPTRPLFTDPQNGDFTLAVGSQAINLGNNEYITTEADLIGNPRIVARIVDLGAYEYQKVETPSTIVTTLEDIVYEYDGLISLREAISYAKSGDVVTFDSSLAGGIITLNGNQIEISKGISIDASEIGGITIDANGKNRIFMLNGGSNDIPIELKNLTITDGKKPNYGGAIYVSRGVVSITDCTISGNSVNVGKSNGGGGAIYNNGTLTVTDSIISDNKVTLSSSTADLSYSGGGGIYNNGSLTLINSFAEGNEVDWKKGSYEYVGGGGCYNYSGTINMMNSSFMGNSSFSDGGGLYNHNGDLDFTNCTYEGNSAKYGGGIVNHDVLILTGCTVSNNIATSGGGVDNYGTLGLIDSTVSYNTATYYGGGFDNHGGILTITNSEILDNTAYGTGGGIFNDKGTLTVTNTTICKNSALESDGYGHGGGIYTNSATTTITDCCISDNSSFVGGGICNTFGTLIVTNSAIFENSAVIHGGGICNYANGTLAVTDCAITDNSIGSPKDNNHAYGAGIYNYSGDLSVTNSIISGNISVSDNDEYYCERLGAGIYNDHGTLTISNSSISANMVGGNEDYGIYGYGAGIYNTSGSLMLANCTITGNSVVGYGGGIFNHSGSAEIVNSIVALNTATLLANDINGSASAYNTVSSFTDWTESENCLVYDPNFPLFNDPENGDYTLAKYSQAINVGNNDYVTTETDLAGNQRIVGRTVDLGAYEYQKIRIDAPDILTGNRGVYVSYGANRHQIKWNTVENAVGYELAYSTDGENWNSFQTSGTSAVVTGLTYGDLVMYRVRSLARGARYDDSPWSESKSFRVCPMDIDGDDFIGPGDYAIMSSVWFTEEEGEEFVAAADINGDGFIGPGDYSYISSNWFLESGDTNLNYPVPKAADVVFAAYESGDLEVDLNVF